MSSVKGGEYAFKQSTLVARHELKPQLGPYYLIAVDLFDNKVIR